MPNPQLAVFCQLPMRWLPCIAMLLWFFIAVPTLAQIASSERMEQLVVSAARSPQPLSAALRPISVLSREDIEQLQPSGLMELLQMLPGLQFGRTGGRGAQTSLFLRGSGSAQLLVLVDGVRVSGASSGAAPWTLLDPEQIERIEVVRGSHSVLYGSDAIGGMVQIFSRDTAASRRVDGMSLGIGSRARIEAAAEISRRGERADFSLNLKHSGSRGSDHYRNPVDDPVNGDLDSYRMHSMKFTAGTEITDNSDLRVDYLQTDADTEYDSSFSSCVAGTDARRLGTDACYIERESRSLLRVAGLTWAFSPMQEWDVEMRLNHMRNENRDPGRSIRTDFLPPDFLPQPVRDMDGNLIVDDVQSRFDTRRNSASVQNRLSLRHREQLVFGVDYYREELDSRTDYTVRSRDNHAAFAEYLLRADAWSLALSARAVDNEQYGFHRVGSADWGMQIASGLALTLSIGQGFRAPTFNDLYFPGYSNPQLRPEESLNRELSLIANSGEHHWKLHAFHNRVRNGIVLDQNFIPQNIGFSELQGLELAYNRAWTNCSLDGSFSFLDPRNKKFDDPTLVRRARREGKLRIDCRRDRYRFGSEWLLRDERYDIDGSRLGGYASLDLYGGVQLDPQWRVQLRLSNLLGRDYTLVSGYNTEGLSALLSLRWRHTK